MSTPGEGQKCGWCGRTVQADVEGPSEPTGWHARWVELCKVAGRDSLDAHGGWGTQTLAIMATVESKIKCAAPATQEAPSDRGPRCEDCGKRIGPGSHRWADDVWTCAVCSEAHRTSPSAPAEPLEALERIDAAIYTALRALESNATAEIRGLARKRLNEAAKEYAALRAALSVSTSEKK